MRVEDALHATRAAVAEGVVPGGGVALIRASVALDALVFEDERRHGIALLRKALTAPLRQIAANAGEEGSVIVATVAEHTGSYGFDAGNCVMADLMAVGILDPTKVVRVALENAASVASMLLTTECAIVDSVDDSDDE